MKVTFSLTAHIVWIRFGDVQRYDGDMRQEGWGRGKDDRADGHAHEECGGWDSEMGGVGFVPLDFAKVLTGLGVPGAEAREAVVTLERLARACTRKMWGVRNREQLEAERAVGISEAIKRSLAKAREWRARREAGVVRGSRRDRDGAEREPGAARAGENDGGGEEAATVEWVCEGCGLEAPAGTPACPNPACRAAITEPTAQEVQTTRQRMRARVDRRAVDRYWMVVADMGRGRVHGRAHADTAGRKAEWRRNPTGRGAWAQRHHRWSLTPRGGHAAQCHACEEECERDDATCVNFATCGMGAYSQCMPDGAPEGGWTCEACE